LRFDRPDDLRRIMASLEEWGTEFLLVDSFRRMHGGNENAAEVVSDLFHALDQIRTELGCGIVITDHTRKRTGEAALDDPAETLRGSTDKRNMVDAHIGLDEHNDRLALTPTKTRHNRKPEPILLDVTGLDDEGDGPVFITYAGGVDKASDKVQDSILALLQDAAKSLPRGEIIGRVPYSKRSVSDGLAALKRRGMVLRTMDGKRAIYSLQG
jgi:hypothetical protein